MTTLEIYNINGVQPDGFKDLIISSREPIDDGEQSTELLTANLVRLKDDSSYEIRPVQTIFYPKHRLQLIVNSEYFVEQIRRAYKVLVLRDGKANQDVKILSVSREFLAKDAYKIELSYYDRTQHRVEDNFTSSWIHSADKDFEYHSLKYAADKYIYTRLSPVEVSPEPEQQTYNNNDVNRLVKSILRKTKTYTFYLNQDDLRDFQSNYHFYKCQIDGELQADNLPAPTITPLSGWDIFKVDVNFIYEVQQKYIQ
jgi:hypothetical protein